MMTIAARGIHKEGRLNAKSGFAVMLRLLAWDGTTAVQATFDTISFATFKPHKIALLTTTALTPISGYVFNSLQTDDPRWTPDTTGYNFLHIVEETAFPTGGHDGRLEYTFTPISGPPFHEVFEFNLEDIWS